jgi:hypothetical protein
MSTPVPDLDALLARLVLGVTRIFCSELVGVYLHGSLAWGDFNPATSDVDFVVVLRQPVPELLLPQLKELFAELIAEDPMWAALLEGCFMPESAFVNGDRGEAYPSYDEGKFLLDHKGINNAMQRHILRERGIVLVGEGPHTFIAPVTPEELEAESRLLLHNWWKPQLENQQYLSDRVYQAYAVLTMCRISYTLNTGKVTSKPRAAVWMKAEYPEWAELIDRAVAWKKEDGVDDFGKTLSFISAVVAANPM